MGESKDLIAKIAAYVIMGSMGIGLWILTRPRPWEVKLKKTAVKTWTLKRLFPDETVRKQLLIYGVILAVVLLFGLFFKYILVGILVFSLYNLFKDWSFQLER